jgi:hypothetical protein
MPIPKPHSNETEEQYIGRCISEISSEYTEEGQPYAVCKSTWDNPTELAEHETEPELQNLPDVKVGETEDDYLGRCIPILYPDKYDQQIAASYCADHYQNKVTVTELKNQNLKSMKAKPMSDFDRKKLEFQIQLAVKELREKGINLAPKGEGYTPYPFDTCVQDQLDKGYDEESAHNICGAIKRDYGH